jgi:hypothetical protein
LWPSGLYLVKSRSDHPKAPWDSHAADPDEDGSMLGRMVLALSAVVLVLPGSAPALAKDCPKQDFTHEAREEAVRKAPSCREALDVMEASLTRRPAMSPSARSYGRSVKPAF